MGKERPRIYISGPITLGNGRWNFFKSVETQAQLIESGFAPLNPVLTMMLPGHQNISHEAWLEVDLPWIECADAVLRLPGESAGADEEVAFAEDHNIPVFISIETLEEWNDERGRDDDERKWREASPRQSANGPDTSGVLAPPGRVSGDGT